MRQSRRWSSALAGGGDECRQRGRDKTGRSGSCAFLRWCVDRAPAVIQKFSTRAVEREPVSAIRRWLVVAAIDRMSREVTIEQGSGAPVTDNCQVAVVGGFRQDLLDGANNPRLGNAR